MECMGIFWALVKSLGSVIVDDLTKDFIEALQKEEATEDNSDEFLNTVGVLGSIAPITKNMEITFMISQFLLRSIKTACNEPQKTRNLEVIIESLNAIYDIFGDKEFEYDYPIFVQHNYLTTLKDLEPKIKEFYKKIDKSKEPHIKVKMEETWINLDRFIQYKASERE